MLADLEKLTPSDSKFDAMFREFRAAVLQHATAEENEVFPLLEQNVPGARLLEMADAMVGPFVAMVDKVRDKLAEHQNKN